MDAPLPDRKPAPYARARVVHHERETIWRRRIFAFILTAVVLRLQLFILADQLDKSDITTRYTPCLITAASKLWREINDHDWPLSLLECYAAHNMRDVAFTLFSISLTITGACAQLRWWKKIRDDNTRDWTPSWVIWTWFVLAFYALPMLLDGRLAGVVKQNPICDIWKILSVLSAEGSIAGEAGRKAYRQAKWSPLFRGCARWSWRDLFMMWG